MLRMTPLCSEWLHFLIIFTVAALVLLVGRRVSRLPARLRNAISVAAAILAMIAASAHFYPLRQLLGSPAESVGGEAVIVGYALLLLVGIAVSRISKLLVTVGSSLSVIIILVSSICPLYWHYFGKSLNSNYPDKNGCIQQTTAITCAPASASMLVGLYGIRASEGLLAEWARTNMANGTSEYSLAKAIERASGNRGFRARAANLTYDKAQELGCPFVAYMVIPGIGPHAILVNLMKSDGISIRDPLTGSPESMSVEDFKQEWSGTAIWIEGARPSSSPQPQTSPQR